MRRLAIAVAVALMSACSDRFGHNASVQGSMVDSAGITIVRSGGEAALAPIGWSVSTTDIIEIGTSEGAESGLIFNDVRGVQLLRDGRIVVVDGGSSEVRFFDSQGRLLSRRGGQGDGPGEFQGVGYVRTFGDSVLVQDRGSGRFTLFAADSLTTFSLGAVGRDFVVGSSGDFVLTRSMVLPGRTSPGRSAAPLAVRRVFMDTDHQDTLAVIDDQPVWGATNSAGEAVAETVPFTIPPSYAVSGDGAAYVLDGLGLEIDVYGRNGERKRLRIDDSTTPVTEEMKSRFIDARLAFLAGQDPAIVRRRRDALEAVPSPSVAPRFQRLLVDEAGWLWAEVYRPYEETSSERWARFGIYAQFDYEPPEATTPVWVIFDPDGMARGTVETPIGLEVHHVGGNSIAGVWRDEYGVEYVRKYAMTR